VFFNFINVRAHLGAAFTEALVAHDVKDEYATSAKIL